MWYTNSVAQPAANFISNNNVIKLLTNGLWASHVDPNDLCRIINDQMSFMTLTCLFSYLESFIISSHWCWWILHCSSRENPNCVSSSPTQYASPRHVNACWLQVAVKKSKSPRGCSLVHQVLHKSTHLQLKTTHKQPPKRWNTNTNNDAFEHISPFKHG